MALPCRCWREVNKVEWSKKDGLLNTVWLGLPEGFEPTYRICLEGREHAIIHIKLKDHNVDVPLIAGDDLVRSTYCLHHGRIESMERLSDPEEEIPGSPIIWIADCRK